MELLLAPQNLPFALALGLVVVLAALQVFMLLLGGPIGIGGGSGGLDVDVEAGEIESAPLIAALDWLGVGKVPLGILFSLWAAGFGLAGLTLQAVIKSQSGAFLPLLMASGIALGISLPLLKISGMMLRPLLPRDETEAVAVESLLGSEGEIVVGCARRGRPTQARVRDKWGNSHYVLVEPDADADEFPAGARVLLLKQNGPTFRVISGAGGDD